nr:PREDICTED: zinc finger and BTB domain-containing protein 25 isoform X2 [Latimeria chalumnae]|eukprot:XP_005986451.1 PREDICTED: zinc finger and BTB domain-containing protein 25 isoform X2 [Latimeria chalumnae]
MDVTSHSLVLLQQLNIQREFGFLCDCTVAIGDVYFKAHRAVLAAFSNYFKMIFIHQPSECIKIQPTDIQPDIFSYLLHIMYTGKGPRQSVDHSRLEEGLKFLHANHLSRISTELNQDSAHDNMQASNLYGIQISSQKATKEALGTKDNMSGSLGDRTAAQVDHPQFQLSLAIGLEGTHPNEQVSHLPEPPAGGTQKMTEIPKTLVTVKQEKNDPDLIVAPQNYFPSVLEAPNTAFPRGNLKLLSCHYCGERFESRSSLRQHLYTHASGSLPFGVPSSILESNDLGEVQPVSEDIESLNDSQVPDFARQPPEQSDVINIGSSVHNKLTLLPTDAEPGEVASNYSFSRKRKLSCTACGFKFLQRSQLLEHMYTHTDVSEQESSSSISSSLQPTDFEEEPPCKKQQVSYIRQDSQNALHSVSILELESAFRDYFPQYDSSHVHCHYKCVQNNCDIIPLDSRKGDKFAHKWLSDRFVAYCKRTGIYWLLFEEGQGMYCFLCRKHNTYNKQNKLKVFNTTPAVRFKKSALQDHAESQQHMLAIQAELASRVSQTVMMEKEKEEISVLLNSFTTAYWLAKEEIPCTKLFSVLSFLKDPCLKETKHFETADSFQDIHICLGKAIQSQIIKTVQQSSCYGLLVGKLTNTQSFDLLLTFIQYVEPITAEIRIKFLFAKDVVKHSESAEDDVILKLITNTIKNMGLPVQKMASLVTDGDVVMTSKSTGVASQLKERIPTLIFFHCLFQKMGLAESEVCSCSLYMADVEEWMVQLWKLFENSPTLTALYLDELLAVEGISLASSRVKTKVQLKLQKACKTRQLSLGISVEAIYNDYASLLKILTVHQMSNVKACGLLRKIKSIQFIGAVYILKEVYPVLLSVIKIFQKGKVNFTTIESSINYAIHQLNEVVNTKRPVTKLKEDLIPGGRYGSSNIIWSSDNEQDLIGLLEGFISAVKRNLHDRFDLSLPLISAFSIFNPLLVPPPESPDFVEYGQQEIKVLAGHFYREAEGDSKITQLNEEWAKLKFDLYNWKNSIPEVVLTGTSMTVTEWCLKRLFTLKSEIGHSYPALLSLAEVCLSMPVTSIWPRKGLKALNKLAKEYQGRVKSDLLNSQMHVAVNGPEFGSPECNHVVYKAVKTFMKNRNVQPKETTRVKDMINLRDSESNGASSEANEDSDQLQAEVLELVVVLPDGEWFQRLVVLQAASTH